MSTTKNTIALTYHLILSKIYDIRPHYPEWIMNPFLEAAHSVWLLNAVTGEDEIIFLSLALSCLRSCLWSSSQQAQDGEHIWKQLLAETKLFSLYSSRLGVGRPGRQEINTRHRREEKVVFVCVCEWEIHSAFSSV